MKTNHDEAIREERSRGNHSTVRMTWSDLAYVLSVTEGDNEDQMPDLTEDDTAYTC